MFVAIMILCFFFDDCHFEPVRNSLLTHTHDHQWKKCKQIADSIRYLLDQYDQIIPAILEIPSREIPYDPSKDYILTRVKQFLGQ